MSKFSTDNNVHYTNALFKEYNQNEPELAIYTTASEDITVGDKTYISLRKQYLLLEDPTEYEIASRYFENWTHWKKVRESSKLKPEVDEWREELEVKLRSQGVKKVIDSLGDGKQGLSSAKWLADKGWEPVKSKGRPTKEMVAGELKKQSRIQTTLKEDALRVGLQASVN